MIKKCFAPLQYQVCEVDCVPCTFLNALSCLYRRNEIPPEVVRMIWCYSLNSYDKKGDINGTSMAGIELIADWIQSFKTETFDVGAEIIYDHLVTQKRIEESLGNDGVAIVEIQISRFYHYILILGHDHDRVFCFDPYQRTRSVRGVKNNVERLKSDGFCPNLAIKKKWMFTWGKNKKYCLGSRSARVAIQLYRKEK